jgi:hypothetical protein
MKYVMKKLHACLIAGALAAATAGAEDASASSPPISTTSTTTRIYAPGSREAASIHSWIRNNSPGYGPWVPGAEVKVTISTASSGPATRTAAEANSSVPLPAKGSPGQAIGIAQANATGGSESWSYTWVTGEDAAAFWQLTAYDYKKGESDPGTISASTSPR